MLLLLALVAVTGAFAQDNKNIVKEKFHFGNKDQDTVWGYAQVVRVDNVLYVSGTVARNTDSAGISNIYRTIGRSLARFGATLQNVVKETVYTTDMDGLAAVNKWRKAAYKGDYPAATWVQISRLLMPDAKIEIEVVAHLPK
ncbi:RidA family protein [Flaviaesturariibacter amylovorans]|uniref:RidA family protein n=2 Tax=Flaviaesturariibacter amylovorans TaxID=1084520 RepID=A0ABP8G9H3_9BACT